MARAAPTPSRPSPPRGGGRPCRAAPAATRGADRGRPRRGVIRPGDAWRPRGCARAGAGRWAAAASAPKLRPRRQPRLELAVTSDQLRRGPVDAGLIGEDQGLDAVAEIELHEYALDVCPD